MTPRLLTFVVNETEKILRQSMRLNAEKKLTLYHLRCTASPEQNDLIAEKEVHCYKQG